MAQGGGIPGGALTPGLIGWVGMDYRFVKNNGIQSWGQEAGHGYGLDHSRSDGILIGPDGVTPDYTDMLDVMSTWNAFSGPDTNYGRRGPGINAWNMRSRGWLDESRVWHCPKGPFLLTLELRPLHRRDLNGFLAAELPPMNDTGGFPRYLVEYRKKENWDNGIPQSCVLVHRFEGDIGQFLRTHSYVMKGTKGQYNLITGDGFAPDGPYGLQLIVNEIDDSASTASLDLIMPEFIQPQPPKLYDTWWYIKTHGGLIPSGPPPPLLAWDWTRQFAAALMLAETAKSVAPKLRSEVLQTALKQMNWAVTAIKKEIRRNK